MNTEKTTQSNKQGLIPRGRSTIITLVIVAIVAFSLGGLFLGGNDSEPAMTDADGHEHVATSDSAEPTIWTCSMHPQIRLPKPGKCPICSMDLIPLKSGSDMDGLGPDQIKMSETAAQLAKIETTPVTRAFAERSIRMVGKLDYDESRVSYITAWVPGRLDRLFVDYTGATVSKGDHLVEIYSPELISAQEELLQAHKAIDALGKTKSPILKSTAEETLKSAREKLRLYGLSKTQIDAIEKGSEPSDHLAITAPASGIVVHKNAKEGMYVSTGTRIYTIADLSKMWVMLEAYESDLPWLRYGQHVRFTSPSFPGEQFDAIISFIDPVIDPKTRTVRIRAIVDNKDGRLKPEMFVSSSVQSTLDGNGNVIAPELAGKWIGPMHPEIVKNGPGKCDICGMDLVPAESLGFTAGTDAKDTAPLLIPVSAPLITGKRAVVYVKVPSDDGVVFEGREITLGPKAQNFYVVKDGLKEGEEVVTNGAFKIDSELQIQAKPSMMSPTGGTEAPMHHHTETAQPTMTAATEKMEMKDYKAGSAKRLDDCQEAQVALVPVYNAYFKLQMALATDKLHEAKNAFKELKESVASLDMSLFKGEAHTRWMAIAGALVDAAESGEKSKDFVEARDAFFHLSQAAIELHDTFGHADGDSFYLTFCPMARDNAGAYWLQTQDTVWNSFYGEAMLRCGEIREELHAGSGAE